MLLSHFCLFYFFFFFIQARGCRVSVVERAPSDNSANIIKNLDINHEGMPELQKPFFLT